MTLYAEDKWGDGSALRVDCAGRLKIINDDGMAVAVTTLKDKPLEVKSDKRRILDLNPAADNSFAVGAVAAEYTLPTQGGRYILIASGGDVWIRENIAAAVNAAGGYCPQGVPIGDPNGVRLVGPTISCISNGANRTLYFIEVLD